MILCLAFLLLAAFLLGVALGSSLEERRQW